MQKIIKINNPGGNQTLATQPETRTQTTSRNAYLFVGRVFKSYLTEEKRNWFKPVLGFLLGSKTLTDSRTDLYTYLYFIIISSRWFQWDADRSVGVCPLVWAERGKTHQ
jgi:hypothetical protein